MVRLRLGNVPDAVGAQRAELAVQLGPGGGDCDPEAIQGPDLFMHWLFNHQPKGPEDDRHRQAPTLPPLDVSEFLQENAREVAFCLINWKVDEEAWVAAWSTQLSITSG